MSTATIANLNRQAVAELLRLPKKERSLCMGERAQGLVPGLGGGMSLN
jgi:hypothetical protein